MRWNAVRGHARGFCCTSVEVLLERALPVLLAEVVEVLIPGDEADQRARLPGCTPRESDDLE